MKLLDILKEIGVNIPGKLKPYKQRDAWFFFKDPEDPAGYHNFHYGGYYYGPNDQFHTAYPGGIEGEEAQSAISFLKKRNIPFEIKFEELYFEGKYVNFDGFLRSKYDHVLDEIGVNNPNKLKAVKLHKDCIEIEGNQFWDGTHSKFSDYWCWWVIRECLADFKRWKYFKYCRKLGEEDEYGDILYGIPKSQVQVQFINELDELDIKQKNRKYGSEHEIYPFIKNPNFIIKTFRNQVAKDNASYWVEIFQKYPQYFPKIKKITDKYIILEKLDVETFKDDVLNISNFFKNELNYKLNPYDLSEWTYTVVKGLHFANDYEKTHYKDLFKEFAQKNPELFEKYKKLYLLIHNILKDLGKKYIDAHNENFGYDSQGNLKMLDI